MFGILGFLFASCISAAVVLVYKITGAILPTGLKRFVYRIALYNWIRSQPRRFGTHRFNNPKSPADIGIFPTPEDTALESPRHIKVSDGRDELTFYGIDDNGNGLLVRMTHSYGNVTEAFLQLFLNGVSYSVSKRSQNSSLTEFSLGNFKLELGEPMRCWRIWYNGVLRNENNGNSIHAVVRFLWKPLDSPVDTKRDINLPLLTEYCIKSGKGTTTLLDFTHVLPDGYVQFGTHHGTIKIDDENEEGLYLYGFRTRKWDSLPPEKFPHRKDQLELFGMSGCDGNAFRLCGTNGGWIEGNTLFASNRKYDILDVDVEPEMFLNNSQLPKHITLRDQNRFFRIKIKPSFKKKESQDVEIISLQLKLNGKPGWGILIRNLVPLLSDPPLSSILDTETMPSLGNTVRVTSELSNYQRMDSKKDSENSMIPEMISFESSFGRDVTVVGGKGASMTHLTFLSKESNEFTTLKGFYVTTTCFKEHLQLTEFRNAFANCEIKDLDKTCFDVMNRIKTSEAKSQITPLIGFWINDVFMGEKVKLAIRSSGILEDGTELSSAGQNETFLGILPENVAEKVVECWASLFTPQSVRYRLNHGQPAVSEMAVVVQEMVHASAAGVLFTADPRTGNPFKIMISANYGLGESVVSAACDPDTIFLSRSSDSSQLKITSQHLGMKESKIVLNQDGLTTSIEIKSEEAGSFCISNDMAIALAKVALGIEKALGELKPVDIEWAVDEEGGIYILQCRCVTSLDIWTDFELIHEADSPYNTKFERFTHANTGEVMPGAQSPLNLSTSLKILDIGLQVRRKQRTGKAGIAVVPHSLRACSALRQRAVLNILNLLYTTVDEELSTDKVAFDISLFGHRVFDEKLHAMALERHGPASSSQKFYEMFAILKTLWWSESEIQKAGRHYGNYKIPMEEIKNDGKALYNLITERLFDLYDISYTHCLISETTTATQGIALLCLANGRHADDWDSDIYEDISKILSVRMDVESADVPAAMDNLAKTVAEYGGTFDEILQNFIEQEPMNGFHWLSNHGQEIIKNSLEEFFRKHGHRCISELDLMRKSWKSDPIPFVKLLQNLVKNRMKYNSDIKGPKTNRYKDDEELLTSLHTPLTLNAKRFMKFLLPYCRRTVWNREKTKSYLIRTADQLKQCYEVLAHLMVKDHFLPDPQLLYFMSHLQIGQLLDRHHTTPKILYKAMRKMKLFPELNKEEYPEITVGIRKPVERDENIEYGDTITATPVSSGKVHAMGKVCRTIEEASKLIEPGDILITQGTDIGWSPFFPILGGIVTELGGLISHGAVVAREYGLPCIVGASHATKIFNTGELLILDAGKGTLTKVKPGSYSILPKTIPKK